MGKRYPGIERATLLVALDNGGINRDRSVEQQKRDLYRFLAKQPDEILPAIDAWFAALSESDLEMFCCGEVSERKDLAAKAPVFADDLLNTYFDEVC